MDDIILLFFKLFKFIDLLTPEDLVRELGEYVTQDQEEEQNEIEEQVPILGGVVGYLNRQIDGTHN